MFIVLTGDNWTTIYIDHYRVVGEALSSFFFISLILLGQYILLMLFIAILVENFDEDSIN